MSVQTEKEKMKKILQSQYKYQTLSIGSKLTKGFLV